MFHFSKEAKATRLINNAAAGQGTTNGSSVNQRGFAACQFTFLIGDIATNGTVTCKVQQSSDDGVADAFTDLEGTGIRLSATDDNKVAIVDVAWPREGYLRPVIVRSTANSVIDGVTAQQYNADVVPVTHDSSTVADAELHHAPDEGTA